MNYLPMITLRPLTEEDFEAVHDYAGDPEVTKIFHWGPNTPEKTREIMAWWASTDWPLVRGIENQDGEIVGCVELREDGGIGYTLRRKFWHQGYAAAALHAMIDIARSVGMPKVYGTCRDTNMASQTILGREMKLVGRKDVRGIDMLYFTREL